MSLLADAIDKLPNTECSRTLEQQGHEVNERASLQFADCGAAGSVERRLGCQTVRTGSPITERSKKVVIQHGFLEGSSLARMRVF